MCLKQTERYSHDAEHFFHLVAAGDGLPSFDGGGGPKGGGRLQTGGRAQVGPLRAGVQEQCPIRNAIQDASLRVTFTSPLGETSEVDGFWDGGRTWRVRFSPDQPGQWKFKTTCTDGTNAGLNAVSGEFVCSAAIGETRFHKHGQVRVARDRRHLEHMDGTPFFWLADTVWNGARVAEPKDWGYLRGRARFAKVHGSPMGCGAGRGHEDAVRLQRFPGAHCD